MSLAVVGAIKNADNAGTEEPETDPSEDGVGSPAEVEGIEDEDSAGAEETEADPGSGVDPAEVGAIEDNAGIEEAEKVAEVAMTHSEVNLCLFNRFSADGVQEIEDAATGGDVREDGSIGRGGEDPALQEEEWVGRQLVL